MIRGLCAALAVAVGVSLSPALAASEEPLPPIIQVDKAQQEAERADEDLKKRCVVAAEYVQKWVNLLRMNEWMIHLQCTPRPPWEEKFERGLRGSCIPFPERKSGYMWLDLYDREVEKVAVHELTHLLFAYAEAADSKVVTENLVENVSRLLADLNFALVKEAGGEKKMLATIGRKVD